MGSIWCLAKRSETGRAQTAEEDAVDFNAGFSLCVILAICFLILGMSSCIKQVKFPQKEAWGWQNRSFHCLRRVLAHGHTLLWGECARCYVLYYAHCSQFPEVLVVLLDRFKTSEEEAEDLLYRKNLDIGCFLVCLSQVLWSFYFSLKSFKQMVGSRRLSLSSRLLSLHTSTIGPCFPLMYPWSCNTSLCGSSP